MPMPRTSIHSHQKPEATGVEIGQVRGGANCGPFTHGDTLSNLSNEASIHTKEWLLLQCARQSERSQAGKRSRMHIPLYDGEKRKIPETVQETEGGEGSQDRWSSVPPVSPRTQLLEIPRRLFLLTSICLKTTRASPSLCWDVESTGSSHPTSLY